ncbi:hypothetical protein KSF78_0007396 [Schistosoma japonicum]|nr:hypothetical protein KSF78_0007396 [Schistosoma japonicum]
MMDILFGLYLTSIVLRDVT